MRRTARATPFVVPLLNRAWAIIVLGSVCLPASADTKPAQETPLAKPAVSAAPKPPAPVAPAKDAVPAVVLDDKDIEGVMGREIYSIAGDDMGRIVDLLVDHKGNLRAAIIDFGGFLGVGSRKIAVDWHGIQFGQDRALLSLTRDQVRVAPEYKEGEPVVILGPSSSAPPQRVSAAHQQQKPAANAPAK